VPSYQEFLRRFQAPGWEEEKGAERRTKPRRRIAQINLRLIKWKRRARGGRVTRRYAWMQTLVGRYAPPYFVNVGED
jgi:hypothetical protein